MRISIMTCGCYTWRGGALKVVLSLAEVPFCGGHSSSRKSSGGGVMGGCYERGGMRGGVTKGGGMRGGVMERCVRGGGGMGMRGSYEL